MNAPPPPAAPDPSFEPPSHVGRPTQEELNWAMGAHLAGLLGCLVVVGSVVGPLVVWLVKKEESEFVADQALEALNFQITVFLLTLVCLVLTLCVVGVFLLFPLLVADLVLTIMAAVAASRGERYRYPFSMRLIR
ncbi:MAG: orotate phosphoribosyltransferase [Planctomycetes bacterium]|jgi:hypothetical protein|nr:orotate phosphoribosyltransferase [Planctomycetota bacterium]MDP6408592.1 DUF4870 domain-containing protein [Planctomycetota bacterium]